MAPVLLSRTLMKRLLGIAVLVLGCGTPEKIATISQADTSDCDRIFNELYELLLEEMEGITPQFEIDERRETLTNEWDTKDCDDESGYGDDDDDDYDGGGFPDPVPDPDDYGPDPCDYDPSLCGGYGPIADDGSYDGYDSESYPEDGGLDPCDYDPSLCEDYDALADDGGYYDSESYPEDYGPDPCDYDPSLCGGYGPVV